MKQIIKRFIAINIGIVIAIFFTAFPIIGFGVFFLTPILLACLAYSKADKWLTGRSLSHTNDDRMMLEIAFICTFGGIAYGVRFVMERWNK
jgi:hypothetical protein